MSEDQDRHFFNEATDFILKHLPSAPSNDVRILSHQIAGRMERIQRLPEIANLGERSGYIAPPVCARSEWVRTWRIFFWLPPYCRCVYSPFDGGWDAWEFGE